MLLNSHFGFKEDCLHCEIRKDIANSISKDFRERLDIIMKESKLFWENWERECKGEEMDGLGLS